MFRYFVLIIFIGVVIGVISITNSAQDEKSEISLKDVKFKEVKIIPTSESMYSLMSDDDIAGLSEMVMSCDDDIVAYGFSDEEKTIHQKFFAIGNLYADLLAKLSGKCGKEPVLGRIKALQEGLDNLDAPNAIYIYLFNLENMVESDEYPCEVIQRFLTMLYPFIEDFAKSSGALVSLQAGHWLVDLAIAAAGQNETLSKQSEIAMFLADEYAKLDAPKGVVNALKDIATLTSKPKLSDEDFETLMMLSEDIRRFLK